MAWRDSIIFGIEMATGTPYVETCHGKVGFETVEDAASFVGDRALLRLGAYKNLWESFEDTVSAHRGALAPDSEKDARAAFTASLVAAMTDE